MTYRVLVTPVATGPQFQPYSAIMTRKDCDARFGVGTIRPVSAAYDRLQRWEHIDTGLATVRRVRP